MSRINRWATGVAAGLGLAASVVSVGAFWLLLSAPEAAAPGGPGAIGAALGRWMVDVVRHILAWL